MFQWKVQHIRNTFNLKAYLSRRNFARSLFWLKPEHSIKFLHLVKTLLVFTRVLPHCLYRCILASLRILPALLWRNQNFSFITTPAKHPLAQPATVATPKTFTIGCVELCKCICDTDTGEIGHPFRPNAMIGLWAWATLQRYLYINSM